MMPLGFATGLSLNQAVRQPVQSIQDEYNYGRRQVLNRQYVNMSVNGVSTISRLVSRVIHY